MASLETIGPLMNGMKRRSDVVGVACEALNRMFQKEQNDLVAQVSSTSWDYKGGVWAFGCLSQHRRGRPARCGTLLQRHRPSERLRQLVAVFAGAEGRPGPLPPKAARGRWSGEPGQPICHQSSDR